MSKKSSHVDLSSINCPDLAKYGTCKRDNCKYKHVAVSAGKPIEPKVKYEYVAPIYKRPEEIEREAEIKLEEKKSKPEEKPFKREFERPSTRGREERGRGRGRGERRRRGGRRGGYKRDHYDEDDDRSEGRNEEPAPQYQEEEVKQKSEDEIAKDAAKEKTEKAELLDNLRQVHEDIKLLEPYKAKLMETTSLDLMFIMDCTGSMSSWIEACKNQLLQIVDSVNKEHPGTTIRISYVGYRDIHDKNRFEVMNFTSDVKKIKDFISHQVADGGADFPEDIAGGLYKALQQDWKAKSKYAVLIADAPCHGRKFTGIEVGDDFPDGDPDHRDPLDLISQFAKKGINFYGIKIESSTNTMFSLLSAEYAKIAKTPIRLADLGQDASAFGFFVQCTVNATISGTVLGSEVTMIKNKLSELKKEKKDALPPTTTVKKEGESKEDEWIESKKAVIPPTMMSEDPTWEHLQNSQEFTAICRTYFIVKDKDVPINWKKPLLQESQITTKVTICKEPFNCGAMRYAYYMYDHKLRQKMVAKLPKVLDKTYSLEYMKRDVETLFICQHLVNEFNDRIVEIVPNTALLMNFVHSFIFEILKETPYKYYYGENFIEGRYQKYNSNAGWCDQSLSESSLIAQAFSHFSWQLTKGYMMIVDLQGATGVLTDPQIHCLDYTKYGKGNLGYHGIMKFFFTHICNPYCKKLGLIHPTDSNSIPEELKFYCMNMKKPEKLAEVVYTICDLCREGFKICAGTIYAKRMNSQEKYCNKCNSKRLNSMREGKCATCGSSFRSSEYWFNMKRTEFPTLCSKCRLERRNKMREDLAK